MAERKRTQRKSSTQRKGSSSRKTSSSSKKSSPSKASSSSNKASSPRKTAASSRKKSSSSSRKTTASSRKSTSGRKKTAAAAKKTEAKSNGDERIRGTAPSAADTKDLEQFEPSDEAKAAEPSTEDAMGKDKRRQVIGHSYGPSFKSQLVFFVIVAAIIAVIIGGYSLAIAKFDQPPDKYPDEAPWSAKDAPQEPVVQPQ